MAEQTKRSSAAGDKQAAPEPPEEPKWFAVRTQSGTHTYTAADEKDAEQTHLRVVPTDTVIDVTAL